MRKCIYTILLFSLAPLSAGAQGRLVEAQAKQVTMNEIAWMGTPVEGVDARQWWRYEWIELHNISDAAVRLDGWRIEFFREKLDSSIVLYGSIAPQGYFLVGASEKIPGVDVNYASLAGKFANTGQRVVLKDARGEIVEDVDAREGWFGGDNDTKLTMERRFTDRPASDAENWGSSQNAGGTPKSQNTLFGKERALQLDGQSSVLLTNATKKEPFWAPFLQILTNRIFIRAFLFSLVSASAILALRRYLLSWRSRSAESRGAGSYGARQG